MAISRHVKMLMQDNHISKLDNLKQGAFILSRSLFNSDIWFKPSDYLKTWVYLIGKCNHQGRKYKGYWCDKGQYFCDYNELKEQLQYRIGFRKKTIGDSVMKDIMKYFREQQMVTTTKQPRGILITLLNYEIYADLSNYEATNEPSARPLFKPPISNRTTPSINKNSKELKNLRIEDIKNSNLELGRDNYERTRPSFLTQEDYDKAQADKDFINKFYKELTETSALAKRFPQEMSQLPIEDIPVLIVKIADYCAQSQGRIKYYSLSRALRTFVENRLVDIAKGKFVHKPNSPDVLSKIAKDTLATQEFLKKQAEDARKAKEFREAKQKFLSKIEIS